MLTFWILFLTLAVAGTRAEDAPQNNEVSSASNPPPPLPPALVERQRLIKMAKQMKETIMAVQEAQQPDGFIDRTVRINFLSTLFLMANASAVTGARVSRAAGTIIRGFVQDSFNLVSIGAYLPRLVFLDGPTQFIEILRLTRTGQVRIPQDVDEAMDTLINFASIVRESQIAGNLGTPFLHFFPNVFRGAELLSTEIIYGVFSWLGPIAPADISAASVEGLWNRWDIKASTTSRYDSEKRWQTNGVSSNLYMRPWFEPSSSTDASSQQSNTNSPNDSPGPGPSSSGAAEPEPQPEPVYSNTSPGTIPNYPSEVKNPFNHNGPASTPPPGVTTYGSTSKRPIFSLSNLADLLKLH